MFRRLRSDIACILERDPAARNAFEVLLCYPGLHALIWHRVAHRLWRMGLKTLARYLSSCARWHTGIEIHPAARIGERVFFDHAMGVVVGETAEIGDGCTIYQGVTLGGTSLYKGSKRHPTLGRNVVVSAGAKILGGFEVGDNAKVGSNAVVIHPVPAGATAVGVPARIILPHADARTAGRDLLDSLAQPGAASAPAPVCVTAHDASAAATGGFSAYGLTPGMAVGEDEDPMFKSLRELQERLAQQERELQALRRALDKKS